MLRRFRNPFKKIDGLVGVDIGSDAIKLLKIRSDKTPFHIEYFAKASFPSEVIVKDEIKNSAIISATLKELFSTSKISTKYVAISIPRLSAIIKNITIDSRLSLSDIESRVWVEANRHFPELIGDVYLDFDILGKSATDETQLDVILVACRKSHIQPYLEILRNAGLTAKIIDVNSFALERALDLLTKKSELKTVGLLNLDFNLMSFIVVENKKLIYAHDHGYDGRRVMGQVNEFQTNFTKDAMTLVSKDYHAVLNGFSTHLRHAIHLFYSSRPNIHLQQLILSGDAALIPELSQFIQQEIGVETQIANPFSEVEIDSKISKDDLMSLAPTLMLCCGLALSQDKG